MDFKRIEDSDRFNSFFLNTDNCHFLQSLEWGKVMEGEGWESLPYLVEDLGKIKASILLLKKKIPFLNSSIIYAPRAPVVDFKETPVVNFLINQLEGLGRENKAIFIRIDPDVNEEDNLIDCVLSKARFTKSCQTWSFWNAPKYLLRLKLNGTEEDLFSRMNASQRNQIRGARKKGVLISSETKAEDLASFFSLMVETSRLKKIPHRKFDYYRALYENFISRGKGKLFFADYEGQRVATGITLRMGRKSWLLYMGSNGKGRKVNANRLLQWEMILWAKKEGCSLYDFRGTAVDYPPDPKNPNYGVYSFKKDFTPDLVILIGYYDLVLSKFYYRLFRLVESKLLPFFMKLYAFLKR